VSASPQAKPAPVDAHAVGTFASLQARLLLATGLLIVLIVASIVGLWVTSQRATLEADMRQRARSLAGSMAGAAANELWDRNWAQLQITVETLVDLDPSLVYVLVSDQREADVIAVAAPTEHTGVYVPDIVRASETSAALEGATHAPAHIGRAGLPIRLSETWLLRPVVWRGAERGAAGDAIIEASTPITVAGASDAFGTLRIGVGKRVVEEAIRDALARALAFGALALGLGLAGALLLARRITRPVLDLAARAELVRAGDLEVPFPDASGGDEIALLSRTMGEMVHGLRDRDFIRDVFGRYVTPELAGELLASKDALKLGGHLQRVTMLMSDLRGFTSLSAEVGPEGMVRLLNDYLGRMSAVILEYKGSINEFIGDAIFALFGAPIGRADDPFRSCCCAIAMQQALAVLNRENAAKGLPELSMGIGINTGEVVAGNIGSEHRVKYGVVGDAVNMTSRIEAMTVGSQILLSEECFREVEARVVVVGPREARVKGKAEPVRFYELRAIKDRPALAMPERAQEHMVDAALEAQCFPIEGKEVAKEPVRATARRVGQRTVVVEAAQRLAALENVNLRLRMDGVWWTQDITAKAGEAEALPGERFRIPLTITAIGDADKAAIARLLADDGPAKTLRILPK